MKPMRIPHLTHRFTLEGLNLERFVNMASKEDIPLLALRRSGQRQMVCEAYQADMPAIHALVEEKGWKITRQQPLELAATLAFLRRRWGIPLGALLALILTVTLYQFIWQVEIQGAGPYRGDIAAYLLQEGYVPGMPKSRMDAADLTRKLNYRYPKVAWFNAYVHDMTLVVDAAQGVPLPETKAAAPGDLMAARDGLVTSLQVHAGTAAVKVGDLVRKGQVLIHGRERGADESFHPIQARGIVTARCWTSRSVKISLYEVKSAPTGRSSQAQQLCSPWLCYPASLEGPPYLAYDTQLSLSPLVGCFFPVWVKQIDYQEVAQEYAPRSEEQVRQEAAAAATGRLLDALRGNEIVDKWVDYCMIEGGFLQATATAEWIADIGASPQP
ncbi:MAG: sporulation protein YqfD [Candidatus Limiplasma sp.]|nr:sporulation protein YqfD [Candidatus Limiplasma sp.]